MRQLMGWPSTVRVPAVRTESDGTRCASAAPAMTERAALPVQSSRTSATRQRVMPKRSSPKQRMALPRVNL